MSMMSKKRFSETRNTKKEVKVVEFDGLMPWSPEKGCYHEEVAETSNDDSDDGFVPWGTPAQREAANKALVNHFAY